MAELLEGITEVERRNEEKRLQRARRFRKIGEIIAIVSLVVYVVSFFILVTTNKNFNPSAVLEFVYNIYKGIYFALIKPIDINQLIGELVWPLVIIFALIKFEKVFAYLFFSMEEFNFFGAKGKLKNVEEVIAKGVDRRFYEIQKDKEFLEITEELSKNKLEKNRANVTNTDLKNNLDATLLLAQQAIDIAREYKQQTDELKNQLNEHKAKVTEEFHREVINRLKQPIEKNS